MKAMAFVIVLSMALLSTAALADVPGLMSYLGTLTDDQGIALDTTVSMIFSISTDSTSGTKLWQETQNDVEVSSGSFNVLLGSVNAIPDSVFNDPERWLGVKVGDDPDLTPRQRIATVGYAFEAAMADTADYAHNAPVASDGDWWIKGDYLRPYNALTFKIYRDTSAHSGILSVDQTETPSITFWQNDGAFVRHCFNDDPYLYGLYATASSALNDRGVLAYGQEWGGYFSCGTGGTAVRGEGAITRYGELGTPDYGVYGQHEDGNFGYIGGDKYGIYADLVTTVVGDYAIYGTGTNAAGEDGDQYQVNRTLGGVQGYCGVGNPFTFGVAGYSGLDYNRSGGCFGAHWSGANWGCLSYRNSSGNFYGGYFTSDTTALGGKGIPEDKPASKIGLGSWGELFGADIHGQVYGIYAEGGNYALYSNGDVFTNGMDVHLQKTETSSMAVLYTNVSTDVTVQTSGFSTLAKGICQIEFDDNFISALSPDVPVVVTVTPTGNSNGVYVSAVTKGGFTVVENNGGKSDVNIAFIAIGRRAGYEHPRLPAEVISSDYVDRLSRGLHNDGDTSTEGEGLYYENGKLYVGRHPSPLPGSNRP
ncbi:hypothetical protein ACFL0G_02515 [Candidatus Zixiibacteriota bacterium]